MFWLVLQHFLKVMWSVYDTHTTSLYPLYRVRLQEAAPAPNSVNFVGGRAVSVVDLIWCSQLYMGGSGGGVGGVVG